jgi:uncharacterized protein YegL
MNLDIAPRKNLLGLSQIECQNRELRTLVCIANDTSKSMFGDPIEEVRQGLGAMCKQLKDDPVTSLRCEMALARFGHEIDITPFTSVANVTLPNLVAKGRTPLAEVVLIAIEAILRRKMDYQEEGIDSFKAMLFVLTDGAGTSPLSAMVEARMRVVDVETRNQVACFFISTRNGNMDQLASLSVRPPLQMRDGMYQKTLEWLGRSVRIVSNSMPGDIVRMPQADDWAVF